MLKSIASKKVSNSSLSFHPFSKLESGDDERWQCHGPRQAAGQVHPCMGGASRRPVNGPHGVVLILRRSCGCTPSLRECPRCSSILPVPAPDPTLLHLSRILIHPPLLDPTTLLLGLLCPMSSLAVDLHALLLELAMEHVNNLVTRGL